jgi:hypothetical protein
MTINVYDQGDLVRVSGLLESAAGVDTDPTALSVKYRKPTGVTTLVYLVDPALVRDSLGNFHVDISCDEPGIYDYRFESTGTGQAAAQGQFRVMPSRLD